MGTRTRKTDAKAQVDTAASGVTTPAEVWDETSVALHEKILYPTIRVRAARAQGSGTIIYSQPRTEPDEDGELGFSSYAITNHHVVADAIRVEKEFDPQRGKYVTRDYRDRVQVEVFTRKNRSTITARTTAEAEIVAYNAKRDVALLRLLSNQEVPFVASLLPSEQAKHVFVFDKVFVVGCGLGMEPFPTAGMLTGKNIEIDYHPYWMGSAPAIYGNSGGAVFLGRSLEVIGIVSRVGVSGGMFGGQAITHLQYFCPPNEIHKFIHDQGFHFLVDPTHTEAQDLKALAERDEDDEDDD
jgi:S1-C subfamily serine protease